MNKLLVFCAFFIFMLSSCKENVTSPESTGSINGKVINGLDFQPVEGVHIMTAPPSNSIINNPDGSFSLNNLTEGDYIIYASKFGYISNFVSVKVRPGDTAVAILPIFDKSINNNPPEIPELLSPVDDTTITNYAITLKWTCSDKDNESLRYTVLLSKENPPNTIVVENTSKTQFIAKNLDTSTTYYWKIIAKDKYSFSESDINSFQVKNSEFITNDNLILHYTFDESNALDVSGNGMDGTLKNNPTFVSGKIGLAARLVGTSDLKGTGSHILLPKIDFKSLNSFTIALWVKEESIDYSNGESYINWGNASTGWIGISNFAKPPEQTTLAYNFSVGCEAADYYVRQKPLWVTYNIQNRNRWMHFTLIFSGGFTSGYIDGIKVGTISHSINTVDNLGAIGKHWWTYNGNIGSSTSMTFQVDDVRVYNIALSDDQIRKLAE